MNLLRVFGLIFEVEGTIIRPKPDPSVSATCLCTKECRCTYDPATKTATMRLLVEVGAHEIFVDVKLLVDTSGATWVPRRGPQPQKPLAALVIREKSVPTKPAKLLALASGAFRIWDDGMSSQAVVGDGDNLVFHFGPTLIVRDDETPLWIRAHPGTSDDGITLDLGSGTPLGPHVRARAGAFAAEAATILRVRAERGFKPVFLTSSHLRSEDVTFSLAAPMASPEIVFAEIAATPALPLYADLRDRSQPLSGTNPVVAPFEATGYRLAVRIGHRNEESARLERVALRPGPGDEAAFRLRVFTYSDAHNEPSEWDVRSEVCLHLRTGIKGRPTALLVAPVYPATSPGSSAVVLERIQAGPLHGLLAEARYNTMATARLVCEGAVPLRGETPYETCDGPDAAASNNPSGVDAAIVSEMTGPWLLFRGTTPANNLEHAKPGRAYAPANGGVAAPADADTFALEGNDLALPALPSLSYQGATALEARVSADVNRVDAGLRDRVRAIEHETHLKEREATNPSRSTIAVERTFEPGMPPDPTALPPGREPLKLKPYIVVRDYGPVKIELQVDPGDVRDYVVLREGAGDWNFVDTSFDIKLDRRRIDFKITGAPASEGGRIVGLLKLSSRYTLSDILDREKGPDDDYADDWVESVVDATTRRREWTGLVLFKLPIGASPAEDARLLKSLIPNGLTLQYLSLTPSKTTDDDGYSVSARLTWERSASGNDPGPQPEDSVETIFGLKRLDVAWYDSSLNFLHAEAELTFKSLLAISTKPCAAPAGSFIDSSGACVLIVGSYDRERDEIRFLGKFSKPLEVLPDSVPGPIRQVAIKSAEIRYANGKTAVHVDGSVTLQDFAVFKCSGDDCVVDFDRLQIELPESAGDGKRKWLSISYPNLRWKPRVPPFSLGFLTLKLGALQMRWDAGHTDLKNMAPFSGLFSDEFGPKAFFFDLRLELMKLPELSLDPNEKLVLDFRVGVTISGGLPDLGKLRVGLRGAAVDNLKLDLLRFLSIRAERVGLDEVELPPNSGQTITRLTFIDVEVKILDITVIKNLSLYIFSASGDRRGFLGYIEDPVRLGPLEITWALVGHNLEIRPQLAKDIMAITATGHVSDGIQTAILEAEERGDFLPQTKDAKTGAWIFAAGLKVLGDLLDGKILFQDNAYYGMAIGGGVFKEWFGWDFAISVLYIKGSTPGEDSFVVSVRVPKVTLPAFQFMGGVVTIEIVLNGGFTLDVGYPKLGPNGARLWDRAFGAIVTPFQGSGGFFFQKRHVQSGSLQGLLLAGGYAVQAGLGGSFGGGIVTVWATAGIYAVLEGAVTIGRKDQGTPDDMKPKLRGICLSGAIGIVVRAGGELNWWIISVRVELTVSAEAGATLMWGEMLKLEGPTSSACTSLPSPGKGGATLRLNFHLHADVKAEACIGSGWFKLCKGITVGVDFPYEHTLQLT